MGTDGFFDVLHSTRSMRRFRQDPVPDEILVKLVEAGIRGAFGHHHPRRLSAG